MGDTNRTQLYYVEESAWGTTPASALQEFRSTGDSLSYNIDNITSNEIRDDRQVTDLIQTGANPGGGVDWELSYENCDDLFEGALWQAWETAVDYDLSDVTVANSGNTYTSAAGDFVTAGIVAGQWIKVSGFTDAANNGLVLVTTVATLVLTVSTVFSTLADEASGDSVTFAGQMLRNGTTEISYSLERKHDDLTEFFSWTGMEVNTMSLTASANSIVTGNFNFIGKDSVLAQATIGTGAATAATTADVINTVSNIGTIYEGSTFAAVAAAIQEISFTVSNNARGIPAIGTLGFADMGVGEIAVTGNLNIYFADDTFYDKYVAGTESALTFRATDNDGNIYVFTFHRMKFSTDNVPNPGKNQDVMENMGWTAIRHATYDCTIQIDKFDV